MDEKEIKCRTLVNGQVKFIWITFKCCRAVHAGSKTTSILCWKSCQKCNDFMKLKRQWQLMVPTGVLPFSINLWWLNLCKNQVKEERGLNICFSNYVKKKKKLTRLTMCCHYFNQETGSAGEKNKKALDYLIVTANIPAIAKSCDFWRKKNLLTSQCFTCVFWDHVRLGCN